MVGACVVPAGGAQGPEATLIAGGLATLRVERRDESGAVLETIALDGAISPTAIGSNQFR